MQKKQKIILGIVSLIVIIAAVFVGRYVAQGVGRAYTMRLQKLLGMVDINDKKGEEVEPAEQMLLHDGYHMHTGGESYAWIDLDTERLAKMDEESAVQINQKGKALELDLESGGLFFNIERPLAANESFDIKTSTMMVGIRGTCGWVEADADHMDVYILEGQVECTVEDGGTVSASGGQVARLRPDGGTAEEFTVFDIKDFVLEELVSDEELKKKIKDASGLDIDSITGPDRMLSMPVSPETVQQLLNDQEITSITVVDDETGSEFVFEEMVVPEGKTLAFGDNVPVRLAYREGLSVFPEEIDWRTPKDAVYEGVVPACTISGILRAEETITIENGSVIEGTLETQGDIYLQGEGAFANKGNITAGGGITVSRSETMINTGTVSTGKGIEYSGNVQEGAVLTGLLNYGEIEGGMTLDAPESESNGEGAGWLGVMDGSIDSILIKKGQIYFYGGETGLLVLDEEGPTPEDFRKQAAQVYMKKNCRISRAVLNNGGLVMLDEELISAQEIDELEIEGGHFQGWIDAHVGKVVQNGGDSYFIGTTESYIQNGGYLMYNPDNVQPYLTSVGGTNEITIFAG